MIFRKEFEEAAEPYFVEGFSQILKFEHCSESGVQIARRQYFEVVDGQYVHGDLQSMYAGFELAMTLRG